MKRSYSKILGNRKRRIQCLLDPEWGWSDQAEPIMKAGNIHYELAEKVRAVAAGASANVFSSKNLSSAGAPEPFV